MTTAEIATEVERDGVGNGVKILRLATVLGDSLLCGTREPLEKAREIGFFLNGLVEWTISRQGVLSIEAKGSTGGLLYCKFSLLPSRQGRYHSSIYADGGSVLFNSESQIDKLTVSEDLMELLIRASGKVSVFLKKDGKNEIKANILVP